jgi:hypothetical protein
MIIESIICLALCFQGDPIVKRFLPTSEVVRVATMAALDEGFNPAAHGIYLHELRKNGKEPIPGYTSIGLYKDAHLIRYYSIRVETGDVVDPMVCKIFRYPDLVKFKKETMRAFGTQEASIEAIAIEIGCDNLGIVPSK